MNEKLYTPMEAAEILKVRKNTVYDMIKRGSLKATKIGKQFRIKENDLNELIDSDHSPEPIIESSELFPIINSFPLSQGTANDNIIICGQDVVLDMLCSKTNTSFHTTHFIRSYEGSYNGLLALYKDEVTIASAHLWDRYTDTYNLPYIPMLLPGENVRVYHVLKRPIGFYVRKGNPRQIFSIEDLTKPDISIINRERGSGVRILLDSMFLEKNINPSSIIGYSRTVSSHLAAAAMVSKGGADCAIGTRNVAMQFANLEFVYLKDEQYDIVIKESSMNQPEIKGFIKILQSQSFKEEIEAMGLYDVTDIGKRLM